MKVSQKDKERLLFSSDGILSILGEYREKFDDEKLIDATYFAHKLKSCVEAFEAVGENKKSKGQYRCYVTEEIIDLTDCHGCNTQSCPINTGYVTEPEKIVD
jgi:hypothetical protein